jgi:DNA-binding NtrC family response regulator
MGSPELFHIMVTDINHHVRNFLQRELEKEGYTVCNIKTGVMAYEYIFSSAPLALIILDPEIFHPFDQTLIGKIVHRRSALQIIIHAYADSIDGMKADNNIWLVEKSGQSIGSLKAIISNCFELFQG